MSARAHVRDGPRRERRAPHALGRGDHRLDDVVIARWSFGLPRDTSAVLLDAEVGASRREAIREAI